VFDLSKSLLNDGWTLHAWRLITLVHRRDSVLSLIDRNLLMHILGDLLLDDYWFLCHFMTNITIYFFLYNLFFRFFPYFLITKSFLFPHWLLYIV
jgi:hypothetical protein